MIAIIHKSSTVVALIEMDIHPEETDDNLIIANWCHAHFRVNDCPITPYTEILQAKEPYSK